MYVFRRSLAVLVPAGFLAACNASNTLPVQNAAMVAPYPMMQAYTQAIDVNPGAAMVHLSRAGLAPLSVQQRPFANGVQQHVVLPNSTIKYGENFIEARLHANMQDSRITERLSLHKHTARELQQRYAKLFPGKKFRVRNTVATNAYGPYGTSFVRMSKEVGCIFAWQAIDKTQFNYGISRTPPIFQSDAREIPKIMTYQVRFCRAGLKPQDGDAIMQNVLIAGASPLLGAPGGHMVGMPTYHPSGVHGVPTAYGVTPTYGATPGYQAPGSAAPTSFANNTYSPGSTVNLGTPNTSGPYVLGSGITTQTTTSLPPPKPQPAKAKPVKRKTVKKTRKKTVVATSDYSAFPTVPLPE